MGLVIRYEVVLIVMVVLMKVDGICPDVCRCSFEDKQVDCREASLTFLPNDIDEEVVHLHLGYNRFVRVDSSVSSYRNLSYLSFSHNPTLKFVNVNHSFLSNLALDNCQIDSVPSGQMLGLVELDLSGNKISLVHKGAFSRMKNLQKLFLKNNTISSVDKNVFEDLFDVVLIDLSYNKISTVSQLAFVNNSKLEELRMSHNYLSRLEYMYVESLRVLDLSYCEIQALSVNSLKGFGRLQSLNLSRNFLVTLPDRLEGSNLRVLDVSRAEIAFLTNYTFEMMPLLHTLNLSSNDLVSGIDYTFFHNVKVVILSNNLWLCDCYSEQFKNLHVWLRKHRHPILYCKYPEVSVGLSWDAACQEVWNPTAVAPGGIWIYSVCFLLFLSLLCCMVMAIKRLYKRKERRQIEMMEREREENSQRLRRMRQQELIEMRADTRNAPDPREMQTPPSYDEALALPRPIQLTKSNEELDGCSHKKNRYQRHKKRRRKESPTQDPTELQPMSSISTTSIENNQSNPDNNENQE